MHCFTSLLTCTLLFVLSHAGQSQATDKPEPVVQPVLAKARYSVDETVKYRFKTDADVVVNSSSGKPIAALSYSSQRSATLKTIGMKPDGRATLVVKYLAGTAKMSGRTVTLPDELGAVVTADRNGEIEVRSGMNGANNQPILGMIDLGRLPTTVALLPGKPVSPGDVWEREIKGIAPGIGTKVVCSLLSVEKINDKYVMNIHVETTLPAHQRLASNWKAAKNLKNTAFLLDGAVTYAAQMRVIADNGSVVGCVGIINGKYAVKLNGSAARRSLVGSGATVEMKANIQIDRL